MCLTVGGLSQMSIKAAIKFFENGSQMWHKQNITLPKKFILTKRVLEKIK